MADLQQFKRITSSVVDESESAFIQNSPFSELPHDIINEISALLCKPINVMIDVFHISSEDTVYDKKIQPATPLFLSSICRAWRSAVWNSPSLWIYIVLSLSSDKKRCVAQIALLQEWVARSGVLPLSFYLTTDETATGKEPSWHGIARLKELYGVLDNYAERWKVLEILFRGGTGLSFEDCFPKISRKSPALSSLAIRHPLGCGRKGKSVAIHLSSSAAPLLRHINIGQFFLPDISFPWAQLLSLTAHVRLTDECLEILRRCSSLRHCRFKEIWGVITHNSEAESIFLPNITSLEIYNYLCGSSAIAKLMAFCSCPAIEKLVIRQGNSSSTWAPCLMPSLTEFISRSSSPVLRSVSLYNLHLISTEVHRHLIQFLTAAPAIETLLISARCEYSNVFKGLSQSFLDHLDPRVTTKIMLPNLRDFSYEGFVDFTPSNLIDVLKCRWEYAAGAKLKSATICVAGPHTFRLTEGDKRCLEKLVQSGMDVSVHRMMVQ